jgi:predicted nucleic acid-binding protein
VKISDALKGVALLGVETSPFIYFVERHPIYLDRMRAIFQLVNAGKPKVVASVIALAEVLVLPIETGNETYQREYREMLLNTRSITTELVSVAIAERAARLRVACRLRTPDALHIATAIIAGCDAFLTNDKGLRRVTEIPVLVLDELEVDEE